MNIRTHWLLLKAIGKKSSPHLEEKELEMSFDPRIQDALNSPDPLNQLRILVQALQCQGQEQSAIVELFEESRQQLREAKRDKDEDVILEAMDFLVGWCSPHMSLEPKNRC
jgi:hypothetical protein